MQVCASRFDMCINILAEILSVATSSLSFLLSPSFILPAALPSCPPLLLSHWLSETCLWFCGILPCKQACFTASRLPKPLNLSLPQVSQCFAACKVLAKVLQGETSGKVRPEMEEMWLVAGAFVGVLKVKTTKQPPKETNTTFICLHFRLCFSLTDVTSQRIRPSGRHITPGTVKLCNRWSLAALRIQNLASVWSEPQTHHSLAAHGHERLNTLILVLFMLQLKSHDVKSLTKKVSEKSHNIIIQYYT